MTDPDLDFGLIGNADAEVVRGDDDKEN